MRVPVYERQVGINPMPGARMSAPGDANAYGAGVAAAITGAADRMTEIAQDMEDARTLELFNAFKRESAEYHEHPDKGLYNARKGFGAAGATKDADAWIAGKADEYARKVPGARAKRNFQRMAGQLRDTMFDRNSRFEAGEIKKYRDAEADAAIQNGLDDVAMNYDDDAAAERARDSIYEALELKTRGMGEEARKAAIAEQDNAIATTRLSRMLNADPERGQAWFEEHQGDFTADGLLRAEKSVKSAMENLKAERERLEKEQRKDALYGVADDVWNQWGRASLEAREAIYANPDLTNEEKERAWQKLEAREADVARAERQDELDWKNGWINRIIESSRSYEDAMEMVTESGASGATRLQFEKLVKQVWQQEKFKESITDWAQAFQEIKSGKFSSIDEIIYRWGGRLKTGTLQGLIRMFYTGNTAVDRTNGGGRGGKIEYVGYSFSKAVENAMLEMDVRQGTRDAAMFCTLVGEELAAFEKDKGRNASALEKQEILDRYVKAAVASGDVNGMPGYMNKIAEDRGFVRQPVYNSVGWVSRYGYFKSNGDGTFTEFDPSMAYDLAKVGGADEKDDAPLPPLPPLPPIESGGVVKTGGRRENPDGQRPRRMADGSAFPNRRPTPDPEARIRRMPGAGQNPKRAAGRESYESLKDVVDGNARTYGVEPELIRAVISVESSWNTRAVSEKGAKGLMQFIPKTAKRFGITDPFDAEQSIRAGARYLGFLLKRYNGNIERAVGAYNTGEGNMDKFIAGKKKLHPETVKYIPKVMKYYRMYKNEAKRREPQKEQEQAAQGTTLLMRGGDVYAVSGEASGDVRPGQRKPSVEECLFMGPGSDFQMGGMF